MLARKPGPPDQMRRVPRLVGAEPREGKTQRFVPPAIFGEPCRGLRMIGEMALHGGAPRLVQLAVEIGAHIFEIDGARVPSHFTLLKRGPVASVERPLSCSRARAMRDMTVPAGTPSIRAAFR